MTDRMPFAERQVEIKKDCWVQFCYPDDYNPEYYSAEKIPVPVLVDLKKLMRITPLELRPPPHRIRPLGRSLARLCGDAYEIGEKEKHDAIRSGILKRGEMDMPHLTYSSATGNCTIISGHHRLNVFQSLEAEKILVLVAAKDAGALRDAAGWNEPSRKKNSVINHEEPPTSCDWAETVRRQREAFAAQQEAKNYAGRSRNMPFGR